MSPQLDRPAPPYAQIADHYRQLIHDGTLAEGARLPSVTAAAQEWGVSNATAAKALSQLQVEGLVYSSPRGSWVAGADAKASSPQTRAVRSRHGGTTGSASELHRVTAAEVVTAPVYVAELLALDDAAHDAAQVIRREWITSENGTPRMLTVTWYPAALANEVPELLADRPEDVGLMLRRIEQAIGPAVRGRDYMHARPADRREAGALGIQVGTAILAGTWMLWTADGSLIEYGEYVLPPRHTLSYPYEIPASQTD